MTRLGVWVTAMLATAGAMAEEAESASDSPAIEEIIVTATYRETSLMDTPIALSAADADMIDQLGPGTCPGSSVRSRA